MTFLESKYVWITGKMEIKQLAYEGTSEISWKMHNTHCLYVCDLAVDAVSQGSTFYP